MRLPPPIEDYALLGDGLTAALVSRAGSVDWLCWPRFDSGACFAALLGTAEHGHWAIGPADPAAAATRAYVQGSLVLRTEFAADGAAAELTDFMPPGRGASSLVRRLRGLRGRIPMRLSLALRFDYGSALPWARLLASDSGEGSDQAGGQHSDYAGGQGSDHAGAHANGHASAAGNFLVAVAGPDLVVLRCGFALPDHAAEAPALALDFELAEGEVIDFVLSHGPSHLPPPPALDVTRALADTLAWWQGWSARATYHGPWAEAVGRSLAVLRALVHQPTGGIVAAPTTSLPEALGGQRNWDYRLCWLRDSTLTVQALMAAGYTEDARAWRDWLHRSIAGRVGRMQILYGVAGERLAEEWEAHWLPGYQGARPVRIGNAAVGQLQLDVFGEVMDGLHDLRRLGVTSVPADWQVQRDLALQLEQVWEQPDEGIWEVRGKRRHFTHSKVMAWVALDRAIRDAEAHGLEAPLERWRATRTRIHEQVCTHGFHTERNSFVQSYDRPELDASLLLIAHYGFLPADDPRMIATVAAIGRELMQDGLVLRYRSHEELDGMPPGEGVFLACSFWYADVLHMQGRRDEARALFERLVALGNDLGLFSEEYDPHAKRFTGNFPQAFTHAALVTTAVRLSQA